MERLTNKRTAQQVRDNVEKLQAKGFDVDYSLLYYIKLAEYEDNEELRQSTVAKMTVENAELRLELSRLNAENEMLRAALDRQIENNKEYD